MQSEYENDKTHESSYKKVIDLLHNSFIKEIRLKEGISDLVIEFSNGIYIDVLSDSNTFENWTLSDNNGFLMISLAGGELCTSKSK